MARFFPGWKGEDEAAFVFHGVLVGEGGKGRCFVGDGTIFLCVVEGLLSVSLSHNVNGRRKLFFLSIVRSPAWFGSSHFHLPPFPFPSLPFPTQNSAYFLSRDPVALLPPTPPG